MLDSTVNLGDGSERVRIAGADTRGSVGTTRSHHARTARSLPAATAVSSSCVMLLKPINSNGIYQSIQVLVFFATALSTPTVKSVWQAVYIRIAIRKP